MDTLESIVTRRSIRRFKAIDIPEEIILKVIEAGTWAPSGLNNQPWKFVIVRDKNTREALAGLTRYGKIILSSPVCIVVFLDNSLSYDRVKDIQAMGACIQNMLLAIHSMGLGAVWLGEILKNRQKVEELLSVPGSYELMAVVSLGYPDQSPGPGARRPVSETIFKSI